MSDTSSVEAMWTAFLEARPALAAPDDPVLGVALLRQQVRRRRVGRARSRGTKRATAGALWSYEAEGEDLPQVGEFSVITDWDGRARCVIRATSVEVVAFADVTEEFAATEGEGDGSLDYWRRVHSGRILARARGLGRAVEPDMPVVCERFEVVFGGE